MHAPVEGYEKHHIFNSFRYNSKQHERCMTLTLK